MKKMLLILLLLWLAGCQSLTPPPQATVNLGDNIQWRLPALDWVKAPSQRTQQVVAWHGDSRWQLVGELGFDREAMTLTALSGFGTFLFQARFDGQAITVQRSALLPQKADPAHLLADLLLCLMPQQSLEKSLAGEGVEVIDGDATREIVKGGKVIAIIAHQAKGFRFEQQQLGYGFEVTYE